MERQQTKQIIKDLEKKIVFLVGPRQVGKTWLAKHIGRNYQKTTYLNYDHQEERTIIRKEQWLEDTQLLILDELHKMKGWKNYLKGVFDTKPDKLKILVTGSARLDTFRQSGDSLAGRFLVHHLMPLSLAELKNVGEESSLAKLLIRGGFPEPLLAENDIEADRFRQQYIDGLIWEDVLNFERIDDFKAMRIIFELLRRKVGSPISLSSIAADAQISPATVKRYINILESLYIVFKVAPYSKKVARSILKEPKIYFYDTGLVIGAEGIRLENMVAVSLLKDILGKNDYLGKDYRLHYVRTKNQQEVDFAIASEDGQVDEILEVKLSDNDISKHLAYFSEKYGWPGRQLVANLKNERQVGNIKLMKAESYLKELSF